MRITWTRAAEDDLEAIEDYIARDDPLAAIRLVLKVVDQTNTYLAEHPRMGRPGRNVGTREWVVPGTPYIVAYRVRRETVQILRVQHGAQRWPKEF